MFTFNAKTAFFVIIGIIGLLFGLSYSSYAQTQNQKTTPLLGWDLTYSSVLQENKIGNKEWIREWLGPNYESPVKNLIENWKDEPIISSILIEQPAFHAGEHIAMWYVRTEKQVYYWRFIKEKPNLNTKKLLKPETYDTAFKRIFSWQQAEPLKAGKPCYDGFSGYIGFLSLYEQGKSRQMLLSLEDHFIFESKDCEKPKLGRLSLLDELTGNNK